jgi:hypothetical protein
VVVEKGQRVVYATVAVSQVLVTFVFWDAGQWLLGSVSAGLGVAGLVGVALSLRTAVPRR